MDTYPKLHAKTALLVAITLVVIFTAMPSRESPRMATVPVSLSIKADDKLPAPTYEIDEFPGEARPGPVGRWEQHRIRPGDSMSNLFKRAGLSASELYEIMSLGRDVDILRKILPGKTLALEIGDDHHFLSLRYEESPLRNLIVSRTGDSFEAYWQIIEPEVLISYVTATISEQAPSLYHAGKKAGLSDNIIMQLSYIFQWDISFALDLRRGDSFTLMFEDIYVEGEKVKEGEILAARFDNMGRRYTAVLYEDSNGRSSYFTPEGHSMRKAFLRDPVHFSYVSSSFNLKRLHPIHKRVMPHRGIDYAASQGTPVLASGDGKVSIARQNSSSGRYVVIQHGQQYTTKYLHLSAFANGIRAGKAVKQGDIIGYVGATGWATAPHLHYEFLVNGVHRNPRTVKLPQADPVSEAELARFNSQIQPHLARLYSVVGDTGYAMATPSAGVSTNDGG
ncbi:MAG: peptidoglycan DD-metalloendopeptidase family protein [Pseudomonadales bacterium]